MRDSKIINEVIKLQDDHVCTDDDDDDDRLKKKKIKVNVMEFLDECGSIAAF